MAPAFAWPMVLLMSFNSSPQISECADITGVVFNDINGNGFRDRDEPGLPGIRLTTVKGIRVLTDIEGRFHIPCVDLPDRSIGSNIVVKLDPRSLPLDFQIATENPRVVRVTAGKVTRLNFGVSQRRVVRVTIRDDDFREGSDRLTPKAAVQLEDLFPVLLEQAAVVEIRYIDSTSDLTMQRAKAVEKIIADRWQSIGAAYKLEFQIRIETAD